jgi:hypothetical protein
MTDMGPLLVLLCTTASDTASAVTPLMGSWHTEREREGRAMVGQRDRNFKIGNRVKLRSQS